MKVIFFGTPQFAVPSLERLLETDAIEVLAVVTQPDKPRGRGKQLIPSPVKKVAIAHEIPVWQPKRIKKDPTTLEQLRQAEADFFAVVAYGQILSREILDMPRLGCINVHGSLLPKYRGAAPIQWSLYHGESTTGITTMLMDEGMDTGDMLLWEEISVGLLDNAIDIARILADKGSQLLIETLEQLAAGNLVPQPQDDAGATYAPLIQKSDYQLDWTREAIALHNQVRGFFPNCTTQFRSQPLKVLATVPVGEAYRDLLPLELTISLENSDRQPGTIIETVKQLGPVVQTGEGLLLLKEVQQSGKPARSGWDFVNGNRLQVGEILGES